MRVVLVASVAVLMVACTQTPGDRSSPASPSAVATVPPPPASIAIAGLEDGASVGRPIALAGTIVRPDSVPESFTTGATWTSSHAAVATVDDRGLVTPLAEGRTTIGVTLGAVSGRQDLDVYANVEGTWQFRFSPSFCSQTGPTIGMGCRDAGPLEQTRTVTVTQRGRHVYLEGTGLGREIFTGVQTASGEIDGDGGLDLTASGCRVTDHAAVRRDVREWRMQWSRATQSFVGQAQWEQNSSVQSDCNAPPRPAWQLRVDVSIQDFRRQ